MLESDTIHRSYDAVNRLMGVSGALSGSFTYDALGSRWC